jgi:hypothetical protein
MQQGYEIADDDFERSFIFEVEGELTKTVVVVRQGQAFAVLIRYSDGPVQEETRETFEADGTVTVMPSASGLYLTSCRSLLSDRIRLRRTRFF